MSEQDKEVFNEIAKVLAIELGEENIIYEFVFTDSQGNKIYIC